MGNEIKTKNETLAALAYYYEKQEPATRECLLALKFMILSVDENIVHVRKYQIPFFRYKEFNLGFLWVHRKKILVGFVRDRNTFTQTTARKKDSMTTLVINPLEDIPIENIKGRFKELIDVYKKLK